MEGSSSSGSNLPPWFMPLLDAEFYKPCPHHPSKKCNFFCWDATGSTPCREGLTLCDSCRPDQQHARHIYFQVFKTSDYPAIVRAQIAKFYDVSDVQGYIINSKKVVYLNPRPRKGNGLENHRNDTTQCEACGRELCRQPYPSVHRFCSIRCKLAICLLSGVIPDPPLVPEPHPVTAEQSADCPIAPDRPNGSIDDPRLCEDARGGTRATGFTFGRAFESNGEPCRMSRAPMSSCCKSYRKRGRKGVPRRSPQF